LCFVVCCVEKNPLIVHDIYFCVHAQTAKTRYCTPPRSGFPFYFVSPIFSFWVTMTNFKLSVCYWLFHTECGRPLVVGKPRLDSCVSSNDDANSNAFSENFFLFPGLFEILPTRKVFSLHRFSSFSSSYVQCVRVKTSLPQFASSYVQCVLAKTSLSQYLQKKKNSLGAPPKLLWENQAFA
jgi:hypothetical protein